VSQGEAVCPHVAGRSAVTEWPPAYAAAWGGLLDAHKHLTRALEAELEASHGLTLSALEVLGRLSTSEDGHLRLSALAQATGLSLSRVSRLVDLLEHRSLVQRRRCPGDARAVEAHLTEDGGALVASAQAAHAASVQARIFDLLAPDEAEILAALLGRLATA
jgi:DNA-binding MarR family transcriptional regulator